MKKLTLQRYPDNPLLTPSKNTWENLLVFNPGVVKVGDKIHMLYRAMGTKDQVSRLGHAVSTDGYHFIRDPHPAYYGLPEHVNETLGIEDPRAVNIDGLVYITYTSVAENPFGYVDPLWKEQINKTAHISLSTTKNFISFDDYDVILPNFMAKNASLFPKKVNGEYWLLYRKELTTYFARSSKLSSWSDAAPVFTHRKGEWDSIRTGIGTSPFETEKGWLIFYHGVDHENTYRLGIIILDLDDPTKVVYRSDQPVLEPEEPYEKVGFIPNVVFTCGAAELGDIYYVYYGAADMVIGVATISKEEILAEVP